MRLQLGIQSLKMPLERLEQKRRLLEEKLEAARYQRVLEGDMLEGDQKRAVEQLEEKAGELRQQAYQQISETIHNSALVGKRFDETAIRQDLSKVVPAFFEHAFGEMSRSFEKEIGRLLASHQTRCEELIQGIGRDAAEIFEIPFVPSEQLETLELEKKPHWVTHVWDDSFGLPPEGFWDGLLPGAIRRRRILKRTDEKIDSLVVQNVENVRWSTYQILNDTFRNFADMIDKRLAEAVAATREAIEAAYTQRKERAKSVESELAKMDGLKNRLVALSNELQAFQKSIETKEG